MTTEERLGKMAALLQQFIRLHTGDSVGLTNLQIRDKFVSLVSRDAQEGSGWMGTHCDTEESFDILFEACLRLANRVN